MDTLDKCPQCGEIKNFFTGRNKDFRVNNGDGSEERNITVKVAYCEHCGYEKCYTD